MNDRDGRVRYDVFDAPSSETDTPSLLGQVLENVRAAGGRIAVVDENRSSTYRQLWDAGSRLAGALRHQGCRDGDRVCIDHPNSVEWVESLLGILLAGCAAVPLDPNGTEQHRAFVRENSQARIVLGYGSMERVAKQPYIHQPALSDLALLLYTSGTTGTPKGVMLDHSTLASYRRITAAYLGRSSADQFRNLIAIPLCHSAGCNTQLLPTLALGGTAVIAPGSGPTSVLGMLKAWRPDVMFAVPIVYRRLLDATADDRSPLECLRDVHYGAASAPQTLVRDLRAAMPWARLGNAFGMTEISNVALFLPDEHLDSSAGSIGFPVPGVECEIRNTDESGRGELYVRGPNMARGYWRRPDLTADVFGTGWVRSGDMARASDEGAVYLLDRTDDVINRGGEKIYSANVEDALLELPGVIEAVVVGTPDAALGERVSAVLVGEEQYDVERLRALLSTRLPRHAIPELLINQTEPLPRGSSGKVLKRSVAKQFLPRETSRDANDAHHPL